MWKAVVGRILVCGQSQEKWLCLTVYTPRICQGRGLKSASWHHMWAIRESLLCFLNLTWDSLLEGRGSEDPK